MALGTAQRDATYLWSWNLPMLARHGCRLRTGKRCSAKHEASALELAFAERTIVPFICMRRTMNTTAYGMRLSDKTCTVLGAQLHA